MVSIQGVKSSALIYKFSFHWILNLVPGTESIGQSSEARNLEFLTICGGTSSFQLLGQKCICYMQNVKCKTMPVGCKCMDMEYYDALQKACILKAKCVTVVKTEDNIPDPQNTNKTTIITTPTSTTPTTTTTTTKTPVKDQAEPPVKPPVKDQAENPVKPPVKDQAKIPEKTQEKEGKRIVKRFLLLARYNRD